MALTNLQVMQKYASTYGKSIPSYLQGIVATNMGYKYDGDALYQAVTDYYPSKDMFIGNLVNKIGLQVARGILFDNPLAKFRKENLPFGDTVEDMYVDRVDRKDFNTNAGGDDIFKKKQPNVAVNYHKLNRFDSYETSVSDIQLKQAFTTEYGLQDLISRIIAAPSVSNEIDSLEYTKKIFTDNLQSMVVLPLPAAEQAKEFLKTIKKFSKDFKEPTKDYNSLRTSQVLPMDRQEIILTNDLSVDVDMDYLAAIYHLDKASVEAKMTEVRSFNNFAAVSELVAVFTDRDGIQIRLQELSSETQRNPISGFTNIFLKVFELYSYSLYRNLIGFVPETSTKFKTLTITGATASCGTKGYEGSLVVIVPQSGKTLADIKSIEYTPTGGTKVTLPAGVTTFVMPNVNTTVTVTYNA